MQPARRDHDPQRCPAHPGWNRAALRQIRGAGAERVDPLVGRHDRGRDHAGPARPAAIRPLLAGGRDPGDLRGRIYGPRDLCAPALALHLQFLGAGRPAGRAARAGLAATAMGLGPGVPADPPGASAETVPHLAGAEPDAPGCTLGARRIDGPGRDGGDGALCRRRGHLHFRTPGTTRGLFLDPHGALVGRRILDHCRLWGHGSADSGRADFHNTGSFRGPRHRGRSRAAAAIITAALLESDLEDAGLELSETHEDNDDNKGDVT